MIRKLIAAALLLSVAAVALAQDTVYVTEKAGKKLGLTPVNGNYYVTGPIEEESPVGIKIKVKVEKKKETKVIDIAAGDIAKVYYFVGSGNNFRSPIDRIDSATKFKAEKKLEQFDKALASFKDLDPALGGYPNAKRYVAYKIAQIAVLKAQDDPSKRDDAIAALAQFKDTYRDGWTIVPALKTLAKLYEEAGKADDAAKIYGEMAELPGVPKEMQNEGTILVARMLLRNGKYADAQKKLEPLQKSLAEGAPQRPFVRAYLAEANIGLGKGEGALKELQAAIKGSTDPRLRGLAYSLIGDLHRTAGRLDDAFWAYMRVEAQYNEDPEQQAKALFYLGGTDGTDGLFDKVKKNPARARDANKKLRDDPRFAASPYKKMLKAEKVEAVEDPDDDVPEKAPKKDKDKKKDVKKDKDAKKDK